MPTLVQRIASGPLRSLDEIVDAVDLTTGDVVTRQSRFWVLLFLSMVVATAGIVGDSTATVIGAMIIAPLATPIQGVAAAVVAGDGRRMWGSVGMVVAGSAFVIAGSALLSVILPELKALEDNSQIVARTSPSIIDLVAAAATGFAGAFGIARKDVSDILPGVAIAISLVPPLSVVGVTAAQGEWGDSAGALLLFLANVVAMIVMSSLVFTLLAPRPAVTPDERIRRRRAYAGITAFSIAVVGALGVLTFRVIQLRTWESDARTATERWAQGTGETVVGTAFQGDDLVITLRGSGTRGDEDALLAALEGAVPAGTPVVVTRIAGTRRRIGEVDEGQPTAVAVP